MVIEDKPEPYPYGWRLFIYGIIGMADSCFLLVLLPTPTITITVRLGVLLAIILGFSMIYFWAILWALNITKEQLVRAINRWAFYRRFPWLKSRM